MVQDDLTAEVPSWGAARESERVAYHEAGHAAMLVRHDEEIQSLSMDQTHDYGAHAQGDGSSSKFLAKATILCAGCKALTVHFPQEQEEFWIRGSGLDYDYLEKAIEEFWAWQRGLGESTVRKAAVDLKLEARRVHPTGAASVYVDVEKVTSAKLLASPTDVGLVELTNFVSNKLAVSLLLSDGMKAAVTLAALRLQDEGTIGDPAGLTREMRELIFAD